MISILVLIACAVLGFLYYEDVRVREPFIHKSLPEKRAYSKIETENQIEFMFYGFDETLPKSSIIYEFEGDMLKQVYRKHYFMNNKNAREQMNSYGDMSEVTRHQNIVEGIFNIYQNEPKQTKEQVEEKIRQYENVYTKIEI